MTKEEKQLRAQLKQQATSLGIEYKANVPTEKLKGLIAQRQSSNTGITAKLGIGEEQGVVLNEFNIEENNGVFENLQNKALSHGSDKDALLKEIEQLKAQLANQQAGTETTNSEYSGSRESIIEKLKLKAPDSLVQVTITCNDSSLAEYNTTPLLNVVPDDVSISPSVVPFNRKYFVPVVYVIMLLQQKYNQFSKVYDEALKREVPRLKPAFKYNVIVHPDITAEQLEELKQIQAATNGISDVNEQ